MNLPKFQLAEDRPQHAEPALRPFVCQLLPRENIADDATLEAAPDDADSRLAVLQRGLSRRTAQEP